jgi:hypothetical protein
MNPVWSPAGTSIAFARLTGASFSQPPIRSQIYVMRADGSGQTNLSNTAGVHDFLPAWSPDGKRIAFTRTTAKQTQIFVMNADGSGKRQLTHGASVPYEPAWSPDGKKIVFSAESATVPWQLFVINADGTGRTRLTHDASHADAGPDWQPLPSSGGGAPPPPPQGSATGTVLVNGRLFTSGPIPFGSVVDVTHGRLTLTADVGTLTVYGDGTHPAIFRLTRSSERVKGHKVPLDQLTLVGGDFSICSRRRTAGVGVRKPKPTVVRALWGDGKGRFRTQGRYASATIQGTIWLTVDRCDGTLTLVKQGTVTVRDFTRHRTIQVHAGHSYLAPTRRPR